MAPRQVDDAFGGGAERGGGGVPAAAAGAYEALGDAKRRRAYDADPESFPIE